MGKGWYKFDPAAANKKYVIVRDQSKDKGPSGNRGRIIEVEGYKAFFGMMDCGGRYVYGEWLYKPSADCWYCRGSSYPAEICKIVNVE